ncbi:MAG: ABC-2 family transporter protein [Planctomycetes bacterium]|nr:ABC-2 family transporter protein [Planctomycetota bacterium]
MHTLARYARIYRALVRNCLAREMAFRGHFLVTALTESLWLLFLVFFFKILYLRTSHIAGWNENEMLFLLGTHYLATQVFEMVFFTNCVELSDLIRTGNLDFVLLKPINAQFLLSARKISFSNVVNVPVAAAMLLYAGGRLGLRPAALDLLAYACLVLCGVFILYAILFALALSAFWLIRNQSLFELWFPVVNFAQYPMEIYPAGLRLFLLFVIPVVAVANVPARVFLKSLDLSHALYGIGWAVLALFAGHVLFQFALRRYRSASS